MLYRVSKLLADKLIYSGVIQPESKDIYLYGFEVLISSILSTSLILVIGLVLGRLIDTLSFLIVFIGLRSFSGGFHANKYWQCTVVTITLYATVMLLSFYINVPQHAFGWQAPIGLAVLFFKAPTKNPNKHITKNEAMRHKNVCLVLFTLFLILGVSLPAEYATTRGTIFFTLISDLILLFVKTKYAESE